jgi:CheY-like chemotaxis protein
MANTNQWHVLVVEDEPDGQEVVQNLLDHFNIAADAVGTAEEAIEYLHDRRYHAVVIDLALPNMDGIELVSAIRKNAQTTQLPCLAVTAFHTSAVKQQALGVGFDAYVPKPINNKVFIHELERIITQR